MQVLCPVSRKQIATLTGKGDTFTVKFTTWATTTGRVLSPAIRNSLVAAALYLTREAAAVSCNCDGYIVTK